MRIREQAHGFSLIEALVALALVSVALLGAMSLVWQERSIRSRLEAQAYALRTVEATVESLRSGALVLESALHPAPFEAPAGVDVRDLVVAVEVEAQPVADLFALRVEARYLRAGRAEVRAVQTLHWRAD